MLLSTEKWSFLKNGWSGGRVFGVLKYGTMDEAEVIRRVLSGDEDSFRHLVELYWRKVMAVVRQKLSSPEEVEDVVQDTFVRAYQKLGQLRDASTFAFWLYRIAQKATIDHLRRKHRRKTHTSTDDVRTILDAKEARRKMENDVNEEVRDAVESLPPKYKEVVTLRFIGSMSCKEVAEYLGEPEGTVRNRLFRANEMLKRRLVHLFKRR